MTLAIILSVSDTDLLIGEAVVWLQREAEDLPEQDPEGPDVALGGVLVVEDRLQRHPADRDGVTLVSAVIILEKHFLTESKVCNLDAVILIHQTIPGCEVSVDKLPV